MRRSNLLVLAGIAFFVVGVVIVALVSRDNGGSSTSKAAGTVDVLFAKEDIPAGTNGTDALSKVEVRRVNAADKLSDALSAPSEISNQIFTQTFTKNEQIRSGGLKTRSATATVAVPDGKEAVAVNFSFVAGGAGYIAPGDLVNIYQVIPDVVQTATPRTQLLLTNVKVLDVPQQVAPLGASNTNTASNNTGVATRPTAGSNSGTFLLALDSIDAEKVIFGSTTTGISLYMTRVNDNAAPSGPTTGRTFDNFLQEPPQAAFTRDHP